MVQMFLKYSKFEGGTSEALAWQHLMDKANDVILESGGLQHLLVRSYAVVEDVDGEGVVHVDCKSLKALKKEWKRKHWADTSDPCLVLTIVNAEGELKGEILGEDGDGSGVVDSGPMTAQNLTNSLADLVNNSSGRLSWFQVLGAVDALSARVRRSFNDWDTGKE